MNALGERSARDRRRRSIGRVFHGVCVVAAAFVVLSLLAVLAHLFRTGLGSLDVSFLSSFASRVPERAGVVGALAGSLWLLALTALIAFPISVGSALYLEEYATDNALTRLVQANIANLAGVPSVVYGILGLALFVRAMGLGRSVLAGALTLALLIMPMIILACQEAVRAVPRDIREGAYALGATRWQVVVRQVLPQAMAGILSGTVLALSRAAGETAPLVIIGSVGFIAFAPTSLSDPFSALPLQIFAWVLRPQDEFRQLAAAAIIVLLVLLLFLNLIAALVRDRLQAR